MVELTFKQSSLNLKQVEYLGRIWPVNHYKYENGLKKTWSLMHFFCYLHSLFWSYLNLFPRIIIQLYINVIVHDIALKITYIRIQIFDWVASREIKISFNLRIHLDTYLNIDLSTERYHWKHHIDMCMFSFLISLYIKPNFCVYVRGRTNLKLVSRFP